MDTDTYPREEVRKVLAGMVCVKVNPGKGKDQKKVFDDFGIRAVPTLLLIDPTGATVAESKGKPQPGQFIASFVNVAWNAVVDAEKAGDVRKAAGNAHYLETWWPETEAAGRAKEISARLGSNEEFKAARAELKAALDRAIALGKANWELKQSRKKEAIESFKAVVAGWPDSKEAGEAKAALKKLGVKLDPPAK